MIVDIEQDHVYRVCLSCAYMCVSLTGYTRISRTLYMACVWSTVFPRVLQPKDYYFTFNRLQDNIVI